jgi:hypothetical protein
MLCMFFILAVCATNFAIGFLIAVRVGHGPAMFGLAPASQMQAPPVRERQQPESARSH